MARKHHRIVIIGGGVAGITVAATSFGYLVLCPGIQIDWHKIKGLEEFIGKYGICSNYGYDFAPYTYDKVLNILFLFLHKLVDFFT